MSFSERLDKHLALRDGAREWTDAVLSAERATRHNTTDDPGLAVMEAARMYACDAYYANCAKEGWGVG